MPLGEDILLARHGDRILEMTQDRKNNLTLVRLADGSTDSASNYLVDVRAMVALSPAERFGKVAGDYSAGGLPVSRSDVKMLARLSAVWLAASTVLIGGVAWAVYTYGDPATVMSIMGAAY